MAMHNMTAILAILSSDLRDLCRSGMTCADMPLDLEHFFKARNVIMSFESYKEVCFSLDAAKSEAVETFDSLWLLQLCCYAVTSLAGVLVVVVQLVKLAKCASSSTAAPVQGEFIKVSRHLVISACT